MARPQSIAIAGWIPAQEEILPSIAALVQINPEHEQAWIDPCAGKGDAVFTLIECLHGKPKDKQHNLHKVSLYAAEMEETRAEKLSSSVYGRIGGHKHKIARGDAFCLQIEKGYYEGGTILWLNPPYSHDVEHRRLEQRWLERWTKVLVPGVGVLLFFVPIGALAASADHLATHYESIHCFKLPEPFFSELGDKGSYKQVVVVAKRRTAALDGPEPGLAALIRSWAASPANVPVLPKSGPAVVKAEGLDRGVGFTVWEVRPLDVEELRSRWVAWAQHDRSGKAVPIPGMVPREPWNKLLVREFPVAVPPKAAHLAAGIASGVLSGCRVSPTDKSLGLPDLLLRGAFWKTFVGQDEKVNKDGEVTGVYASERPTLTINVLDLNEGSYHKLAPSTDFTGATQISGFTVGDLLGRYGPSMLEALLRQCPPLHDTRPDPDVSLLPTMARKLYRAQAHACIALHKLLQGPTRSAILLGQVGVGKSSVSLTACVMNGARRILIFCPPHLVGRLPDPSAAKPEDRSSKGWPTQILACFPDAKVVLIRDLEDVDRIAAEKDDGRLTVGVLSETTAKLSHERAGLGEAIPAPATEVPSFVTVVNGRQNEIEAHRVAFLSPPVGYFHSSRARAADVSLQRTCPACGAHITEPASDLARVKNKMRCTASIYEPSDEAGRICYGLGWLIARFQPSNHRAASLFHRSRVRSKIIQTRAETIKKFPDRARETWKEIRAGREIRELARRLADVLAEKLTHRYWYSKGEVNPQHQARLALMRLLLAIGDDTFTAEMAMRLYARAMKDDKTKDTDARTIARQFVCVMKPCGEEQTRAVNAMKFFGDEPDSVKYTSYSHSLGKQDGPWTELFMLCGKIVSAETGANYIYNDAKLSVDKGRLTFGEGCSYGSGKALAAALELLAPIAHRTASRTCGERLYQAIPRPRRIPIANYITRNHRDLFDHQIIDEAHEVKSENAAKSHAAQRLMQLGIPTIAMTGTVMNGYASSLFVLLWNLSPAFRTEFDRGDSAAYVKIYGFEKVFINYEDGGSLAAVSYGTMTDRVEGVRTIGEAPGVMPVLLMRHLLPIAVTLQLADLEIELPPLEQIPVDVELPDGELKTRYSAIDSRLRAQIKSDRFDKEKSGRLFGQLSEMGSYLDRATADTGNVDDGRYVVAYPESVQGGGVVIQYEGLPASTILPKEAVMLDILKSELAEGRNCIVFPTHTNLSPRYKRLIEEATGEKVAVMDSSRVPTTKREAWIDNNVIAKKIRVMVCNPVSVQTGLNNLVQHTLWGGTGFATQIWMEDPESNPNVYRQGLGRSRRIGQAFVVRIYSLFYKGTIQEISFKLLMSKVGYAEAADGLDPEAAFKASGVGVDALAGRSIGKILYELLEDQTSRAALPDYNRYELPQRAAVLIAAPTRTADVGPEDPVSAPAPAIIPAAVEAYRAKKKGRATAPVQASLMSMIVPPKTSG